MPASPAFSINGGSSLVKASVVAGGAVTGLLDSIVGVTSVNWSIIRTDDTTLTTDYALTPSGSIGQQVDTTALTAGTSAALQCVINGGIDPTTGNPSADMTAVAKFFVPTVEGLEVLNAAELEDDNRESSLTHGAVVPINAIIRAGGGSLGDFKPSCRLATAAALPAYTRSGNVITADAVGALTVDGVATALNDRILLKDGAAGADNGLWYVSILGDGGTAFELTRTADANISAEVTSGILVPVTEGTVNDNQLFMLTTNDPIVLNTTAIAFSNIGVLSPLVTELAQGAVGAFTAGTNEVLTSDAGNTAGGVWVSYAEAETASTFPIRSATGGALFNRLGINTAEPAAAGVSCNGDINTDADSTNNLGTASLRWSSVVANLFQVYTGLGDANPTSSLGDGSLSLGVGGASAVDVVLSRTAANVLSLASGDTLDLITGPLQIGATPAAAGVIRLTNNTAVNFRNAAGSADITALSVDGSNTLNVGLFPDVPSITRVSSSSYLENYVGGASRGYWGITHLQLQVNEGIRFTENAASGAAINPQITQIPHTPAGAADTMTVSAQPASNAAGIGGVLNLKPGQATGGGTNGTLNLQDGSANASLTVDDAGTHTQRAVFHSKTIIDSGDSPYTVLSTDHVILADTSGGAITIDLPAIASSDERILYIKDSSGDAAANNITIDASGGEVIDGALTAVITNNYGSVTLYCDSGVGWSIL